MIFQKNYSQYFLLKNNSKSEYYIIFKHLKAETLGSF